MTATDACRTAGCCARSGLRALGAELEEIGAYAILIDELDGGFLLSFQYYDATQGYVPLKASRMVEQGERGHLLNKEIGRRADAE